MYREKIRPSERISKEINEIINGDFKTEENLLGLLIEKSVKKLIQELLEEEATDYLGRDYYSREAKKREGYRNGYEVRKIKTAEGKIEIEAPQIRDTEETYRSELLKQIGKMSPELKRLAAESYVRGMSVRDIEDTFKDKNGDLLISKSGVSNITEVLNEEYEKFVSRDLSGYDVVYLYLDGVYESLRLEAGFKEAVFCAWGILSTGNKILIHLGLGNKESADSWTEFCRNMIKRGLRTPLLVISDGAPGLISAIDECFYESKRQRCLVHKLRNIANKLPKYGLEELMPKIRNVYYQTNKEIAMQLAVKIIGEYSSKYPSAIKCFSEDIDNCLNFMDFPEGHHKFIRTTNLLERTFLEQKRRTKTIPRFLNEKSCLKLVFSILIRVSDKWRKIKMSEYDLALLKNIRHLYGWEKDENNFISKKRVA
jgi:putative transposase